MSIPFTLFAVLICMGIIGFLGISVIQEMKFYATFAESSIEDMNSIDAANIIAECLKNNGDFIETGFLSANDNNNVCDIAACKICQIDIGLKVKDTETHQNCLFGFDDSEGTDHEIFITIKCGDEIHVGRLYVQLI